jgi:hypothetical protein
VENATSATSHALLRSPALLLLAGIFLALVGYWRAWVPHQAAGLALTAWDLTEWIKFLPAWRAGVLGVQREWFYLPLIASGLALALLAARLRDRFARWALRVLSALLCLLVLPPYEFIQTAYQGGEWQGQFFLSLAGLALVVLSPLAYRWVLSRYKRDLLGPALVVVGLIGIIPPLTQLAQLRPVVAQVYAEPVGWGIGAALNGVGFAMVVLAGLWVMIRDA